MGSRELKHHTASSRPGNQGGHGEVHFRTSQTDSIMAEIKNGWSKNKEGRAKAKDLSAAQLTKSFDVMEVVI